MHIIGGKNSKNSIRRFFNLENGKSIPYGTYDVLITKVMLMLVYLMITAGVCCQFNIFMVEHPGNVIQMQRKFTSPQMGMVMEA